MSKLDGYIDKELQYIRSLAGEMAARKPRVGSRLKMRESGESTDPHVERLIEAFAVLTGRIRLKLDDELPEISDALLSTLYPHYLAPTPSMSIVQFKLSAGQADMVNGYLIEPQELESETTPMHGSCIYKTCAPLRIWPIEVTGATMLARQTRVPGSSIDSTGLLRLTLNCLGNGKVFAPMKIPKLRFYIAGQDHYAFALYELILNGTLNISISNPGASDTTPPRWLGSGALSAAGFEPQDAVLPFEPRSFQGYRLLSEYFCFPRKFLFFDVDLSKVSLEGIGGAMAIQFYLEKSSDEIEPHIGPGLFRLGCIPIINLFSRAAEPIDMNHVRTEYPVEVYSPQMQSFEIYKIENVTALPVDADPIPYFPFYSVAHGSSGPMQHFWHASRRPAVPREGRDAAGNDMFVSLVDLGFKQATDAACTLQLSVSCTNRDLPVLLPGGEGRPKFTLVRGGVPSIHTLVPPTKPLRPELGRGVVWGLISHLLLNHMSLCDPAGKPDSLREILQLYNFTNKPEIKSRIDAIVSVNSERTTARAGGGAAGGFCRGLRVTLELDETGFPSKDCYLFASVIERFIALYVSINSFTQLVLKTQQRAGVVRKWPPRSGQEVLL